MSDFRPVVHTPARPLPTSYLQLVEEFPELFYTYELAGFEGKPYADELRKAYLIPEMEFDPILRSPEEVPKDPWRIPSLVELTWCWINFMEILQNHGETHSWSISSTFHNAKHLCVAFIDDKFIDVRTDRMSLFRFQNWVRSL